MKSKPATASSRDSKNKLAKVKRYSQIKPAQKPKAKTRKEIRKQERKNKKAKKHAYAVSKSHKAGDVDESDAKSTQCNKNVKGKNSKGEGSKNALDENNVKSQVGKIIKKETTSQRRKKEGKDFRQDEAKLKKEMEEVRRKRLLEDNIEEDKHISQLEKRLRINKKAIIPASFRTDGLDYLLEICSSTKIEKDKKGKPDENKKYVDSSSENEDQKYSEDDFSEDSDQEDEPIEIANPKRISSNTISKNKNKAKSDSEDEEYGNDDFASESDVEEENGEDENFDDDDLDDSELDAEEEEGDYEKPSTTVKKDKKAPKDDVWEDIYGRLRSKDGAVIDEKTMQPKADATTPAAGGKYVPPARRENQCAREKITKTLKGLLNRLAETNMHNISQQVEQLYMSNSRNEMNESVLELFYSSLVPDVAMSERIILEHIMLVTVLHANVGSEIGAFFIQNFVQKFKKTYDSTESLQDSKALHNLCLLISSTYHFKIVGCGLVFDLLNFLAESFKPKDIELILTILKSVGFRLRKDDPLSLKNFILLVQERTASNSDQTDSRVKFMLEIIGAIKNNNMTKIPNYDPSYGEHLLKMIKQHFHKGNYVTELKIAMQDLLNADIKGKWWVVGSAWINEDKNSTLSNENKTNDVPQFKVSDKLLAKAKKFGMNTDIRRNIFCIIMTAEDYLDAFEKLIRLGLKNQMEREIIHVTVYCALHEKKYNPFYGLILTKLCASDRRFMYAAPLKLEVVEYGKKLGQRKASRLFHISQKRIHEWTKEGILAAAEYERQLENSANTNEAVPAGPQSLVQHSNSSITASRKRKTSVSISGSRKVGSYGKSQGDERCTELSSKSKQQVLDLSVESEVCEWVQSSTSNPTSTEIRNKAIELYRSKGYETIKCSYGWYRRWAERFKVWASTHDDTDPQVLTWLLEQYDDNNVVSYLSLQLYGHETLKRFKSDFKASPGWATRFVKRHHVFLNWDGFIEEKLPLNLQARIDVFLSKVRQMDLSGFQDDQIGCVDEIPLSFAGSSSKDKDSMDSDVKVSRLRKICLKNCDATCIISLRADGSMLPPMVVVKGQKASSLNQVYSINDNPVIVFYSKTTEPTINTLEKWLELVWLKNAKQPSVLFCDSYSLHRQLSTACKDAGIKQEIFPPGCSCKLQPINVYAKLTFRKLIDNLWEEYLKKNSCEPKIKLPSTNEMVEWISHAYETMKQDLHKAKLMNSFKTAGLLAQGRRGKTR